MPHAHIQIFWMDNLFLGLVFVASWVVLRGVYHEGIYLLEANS